MRAREFIIEYKQDITIRQYGPKLLELLKNPRHPDFRWIVSPMNHSKIYDPQTQQWDDDKLLKAAFRQFEDGDPTYDSVNARGGLYVPWIAREFVKGNIRRFEDLDSRVKPILADYHKYKARKDFWEPAPEIKDIMRVDFDYLEEYVGRYEPEIQDNDRGQARTVFEDDTVRIVVPEDQEAACYYGQGTRWCTAATKGTNYFNYYNRQGPLYILLPKKPQHKGEKYQLHFADSQYMDENDDPISVVNLLTERFPSTLEFFKKTVTELGRNIEFAPDAVVEGVFHAVGEMLLEYAYEMVSDMEVNDDYFRDWQMENAIRKEYFVDEFDKEAYEDGEITPEHDDIDWDQVYNDDELNDYTDYNDDAQRLINQVKEYTKMPAREIRYNAEAARDEDFLDSDTEMNVENLENILNGIITRDFGKRSYYAEKFEEYMSNHVTVNTNEPRYNPNRNWTMKAEIADGNTKYIVGYMGALKKKQ